MKAVNKGIVVKKSGNKQAWTEKLEIRELGGQRERQMGLHGFTEHSK
jgi:hypothetical protein